MFAYCRNNPVSRKDISGTTSVSVFDSEVNLADDDKEINGGKTSNSGPDSGGGSNSKNVRGVGGKGWRGDQTWKQNVKTVAEGHDIRELNGGIPTVDEGRVLIAEAGGTYVSYHAAHPVGGISTHTYNHIHYLTETGIRSTIQVWVHL